MADLKSIGSEKLPLDQKLKRIMEIANYGMVETKPTHKTANLEYSITAADGENYGIIRENSKYSILKEGKTGYSYLDGMLNNKKYVFPSFSKALKKLNLLMKPLNESHNSGKQLNLIGEQEEDTKYVLKTPEAEEEIDFEDEEELGGGEELDFGGEEELGGEEETEEFSMDIEDAPEGEEENFTKVIQKLTGKLGQKLRDIPETELDGDLVKYVLNSIISAVDLTKLSEEDVDDIISKIEGDDEMEYAEEGEFDVDLSGEEDLDIEEFGGEEEIDLSGEEELDLETELGESLVDLDKEEELEEWWQKPAQAVAAYAGTRLVDRALGEGDLEEQEGVQTHYADSEDTDVASNDAIEAIGDIFNVRQRTNEGKTHKIISKYFKYSPQEKSIQKINKELNEQLMEEKKTKLLSEAINQTKIKKDIVNSISTYEQETSVKKFLKENKDFDFVGNNTNGSLVFKKGKNLVEITKYGTKA